MDTIFFPLSIFLLLGILYIYISYKFLLAIVQMLLKMVLKKKHLFSVHALSIEERKEGGRKGNGKEKINLIIPHRSDKKD